ncbi:MAG: protoporphyrinogen oxidase [Tatlockia sp.]|nr:protoporphyrinogen oxidase [Tatlockia sp.]
MIRLALIFLILLASVFAGIQLSRDPGYLLVSINHWSLETTFWFALLSLVLAFLLVHGLLLVTAKLLRSPKTLNRWRAKRRNLKAQARTRQGIIEFSEGYWSEAQNHLIKALPDSDSPLFNYLTAARAAQEMGDSHLRDNYLREAQQAMPDAKIAVELTQAQLQMADKQWEQALATLEHLKDLVPRHPHVLKLLMNLYKEIKDWSNLITLLPQLKKNRVACGNSFELLEQQVYCEAFSDLAQQGQGDALNKMVKNLPKNLRFHSELMAIYGRYLLSENKQEQAEATIRNCLRKNYDVKLISLYGQIKANTKQIVFAESLIHSHPHSADLYLCLGRLSLNNNLWGKAKMYFEQSLSLNPSPAAYEELGKLLERLNDQSGACIAYRRGLALKTDSSN